MRSGEFLIIMAKWLHIWHQQLFSTVSYLMTCCLMVPSHHLNQCWLIIRKILCKTSQCISFVEMPLITCWYYHYILFEITLWKKSLFSGSRLQQVKSLRQWWNSGSVLTEWFNGTHLRVDLLSERCYGTHLCWIIFRTLDFMQHISVLTYYQKDSVQHISVFNFIRKVLWNTSHCIAVWVQLILPEDTTNEHW